MTGCPTVTHKVYTSSYEKIHEHNLEQRSTAMLLKLEKYELYGYTPLAFEVKCITSMVSRSLGSRPN